MLTLSAVALVKLHERTESTDDLSLAREHLDKVIESPDSDDMRKITAFSLLVSAAVCEFSVTRDKALLNDGVHSLESAVELCPKSDPAWPEICLSLATLSRLRSEKTRDEKHFKIAIEHREMAMAATPDKMEGTKLLGRLAVKYFYLYNKTHDPTALEKLLDTFSNLNPDQHMEDHLRSYKECMPMEMSDAEAEEFGMRQEITFFEFDLDTASKNGSERKYILAIGIEKWLDVYRLTRSLESLDMSSKMLEESLRFRPDGFSFRRRALIELADLALDKAVKTQKDKDLKAGVQRVKDLLDQMPHDDPERHRIHQRTVNVRRRKAEGVQSRTGVTPDS